VPTPCGRWFGAAGFERVEVFNGLNGNRGARPAPGGLTMCGLIGATGSAPADEKPRPGGDHATRLAWSRRSRPVARAGDRAGALPALDPRPLARGASADGFGRWPLRAHLQRRDLQLPRAARRAGWRLRSDSDSEVILRAYCALGKAFLQRLRGMFALGIWDRQDKKLLLARDRLGVKPLYYAQHGGAVVFASRPQALFAYAPGLAADVDLAGLSLYLEAGYFPAPYTLHRRCASSPPGTCSSSPAAA